MRSSGQGSPRVRRTYTWQTRSQAQDHRQQAVRTEEVLQPTGPSGTGGLWEGPGKSSGPRDQGEHILSKMLTADWLWGSPTHHRWEKNWGPKVLSGFSGFPSE